MKIPQYIKAEMYRVWRYEQLANKSMVKVEQYLESHGIDVDELRDDSGCGLEELENVGAASIVELIIARLEALQS